MRGGSIQTPKLSAFINGVDVKGLLHATLTASNCFSADTYALGFAIGPPPMADILFWSSITTGYVEIVTSGEDGNGPQLLISGMIDGLVLDPIHGTVSIEGRDLSASLVDSYRQQSFVNQTASEVVSTIALAHNLLPVVSPTTDSVGRYYGDGYTQLSLGDFSRLRSDWDLLVQLARENSFDVFVQGRTLFFQPNSALYGTPVQITPFDVQRIRLERNLTLPSDVSARVKSWNSQAMTSYASGSELVLASMMPSGLESQPYLFSASNLTPQQISASAGRFAAELGRLSTVLHLEMPWDLTLSPRTFILLDGISIFANNTYRIDSIERHFNSLSGSTQSVRAALI